MMTRVVAVLLASVCLLQAMTPGLAVDHECTTCKQNYGYICLSNFQECAAGCGSNTVTDKTACQRRCGRAFDQCSTRATEKCGTCEIGRPALPPPIHMIQ